MHESTCFNTLLLELERRKKIESPSGSCSKVVLYRMCVVIYVCYCFSIKGSSGTVEIRTEQTTVQDGMMCHHDGGTTEQDDSNPLNSK